jgi:hypothetical protein
MSAFKSPANDKLTVVILNKSSTAESLTLNINDFSPANSQVYRSSETEHWLSLGAFSNPISLPAYSITTISFDVSTGPQQTLSISSTEGGSVTTPGEGSFPYAQGTNATIIATADSSYHFVNWTGSAVDAGKVADPNAASTTVLMDANYAVVANFQANPPSTDVEIIGSWTTGTTHTKVSGTNRALIFIAHGEYSGSDMNLVSVTYGGQSMAKVIERNASTGTGYRNYVVAFILNEVGVAAASSGTFVPSWSVTPESASYASVFLSNVNQTTSIGASASNATTSGTDPIVTSPLATNDGDMVIDAVTCGNLGNYTMTANGFTKGTDQQAGTNGHTGATGYKSATGAAETPSADYSATVNRQVIIGFVVQAADEWLYGDLTHDDKVDMKDLFEFCQVWLVPDCNDNNILELDLDGDCIVNFYEYSFFAQNWSE